MLYPKVQLICTAINYQFKFATLEENPCKFLTDSFLQKNNRGEELPAWEEFLTDREKLYRKNIFEHGSYELNSNKQGVIYFRLILTDLSPKY